MSTTPNPDGMDSMRVFGAQAREGATKLFGQPLTWEVFSKTLGWFQHRNKRQPPYTDAQLAAIEDGYRNYQAIRLRNP